MARTARTYRRLGSFYNNVGDDQAGVHPAPAGLGHVVDRLQRGAGHRVDPARRTCRSGPPFGPPLYPVVPAAYPLPLRGIQIQIRVVDPRNEHIKVLTIRQDFSDKL